MLIAQISDCHITHGGSFPRTFVDGAVTLGRVVDELNERPDGPDLVIACGDLVNDGTLEEYAMFREIVDAIRVPLYVMPGNHDDPATLAEAFADHEYLPAEPPLHYVVDDHPVRFVAIDTHVPGEVGGCFDDEAAAWLEGTLGAAPDRPTLVALHHPPFATGIAWMDSWGLDGSDLFRSVIERHPQVGLVVAGHVHRPIESVIGSALVCVAPSSGHQIDLALGPDSEPAVVDEPPAYRLYRWTGSGFVSHTAIVTDARRVTMGETMAAS